MRQIRTTPPVLLQVACRRPEPSGRPQHDPLSPAPTDRARRQPTEPDPNHRARRYARSLARISPSCSLIQSPGSRALTIDLSPRGAGAARGPASSRPTRPGVPTCPGVQPIDPSGPGHGGSAQQRVQSEDRVRRDPTRRGRARARNAQQNHDERADAQYDTDDQQDQHLWVLAQELDDLSHSLHAATNRLTDSRVYGATNRLTDRQLMPLLIGSRTAAYMPLRIGHRP